MAVSKHYIEGFDNIDKNKHSNKKVVTIKDKPLKSKENSNNSKINPLELLIDEKHSLSLGDRASEVVKKTWDKLTGLF